MQQAPGESAADGASAQEADADTQDPAAQPEDSKAAEEPEDPPPETLTRADVHDV